MAVQHFANMFFFCTRLDHYSPECSSIAPCTNIINLSIIFVHSPPFHPPFLWIFLSFSCALSFSLFSHCNVSETNDGTDESFHAIYPTHCILISQLFGVVCSFLHWCFPNHNPPPHPTPLVDTQPKESVFQTASFCLSDLWMSWVSVPKGEPGGGCSSVNESLCFQTCCLVSYDKFVGAEQLTLRLQCRALSQRELGDSRATGCRQFHSLITERPG